MQPHAQICDKTSSEIEFRRGQGQGFAKTVFHASAHIQVSIDRRPEELFVGV